MKNVNFRLKVNKKVKKMCKNTNYFYFFTIQYFVKI